MRFYAARERDNPKVFWQANSPCTKHPQASDGALVSELEDEFGEAACRRTATSDLEGQFAVPELLRNGRVGRLHPLTSTSLFGGGGRHDFDRPRSIAIARVASEHSAPLSVCRTLRKKASMSPAACARAARIRRNTSHELLV